MIDLASGLRTDLYELTMAAAYFENRIHNRAIFELFVRRLPNRRSYLIAAGLEQALDYLAALRFSNDQIDYLREHPSFKNVSREFFDYLAEFRFTGEVWAMPEGTAAWGMEPLLRVSAPMIEAQIVETFLLSTLNFQTMIASKAARIVTAARGRNVIEFGTRRAHGPEAGLLAARAAYVGGTIGTSNVEAGYLFGVPTFGTLAHSFIMSFDEEDDAFRAFLKVFPDTATVLVDTYDTVAALRRLAADFGPDIASVRLDSGDLLDLSVRARRILDEAGMKHTKIMATNDLNEYRIADLIERGAAIDSFGVGTELATSYDAPALSGVYKLVALEENGRMRPRMKLSEEKATYPGPKQVWRFTDNDGKYRQDTVALDDEDAPGGRGGEAGGWRPLLEPVMKNGRVVDEPEDQSGGTARLRREVRLTRLNRARSRTAEELRRLPDELLALESEPRYRVEFSTRLAAERDRLRKEIVSQEPS
ncbi:MAG TPA: nicotinate phosphoribosyltransferase [Blastocatellia bacterium]